ncbi:MAG: hypothetical protein L0H64_17955 [Pseudonocardia sp.]|nr:hypothetical protein [Pseudonocardia sp.]
MEDIQEDEGLVSPLVGQTVTISAEVSEVVGPQEGSAVAVTGVVRRAFEVGVVEDEFGFDYDDGLFDDADAQNYIVAEAVDPTLGDTAATPGA